MKIQIRAKRRLETGLPADLEISGSDAASRLEVNVIFTNEEETLAALKTACNLAMDLGASINLVATQLVSWQLPLTRPPVAIRYTEQRLFNLVCQGIEEYPEINVQVCFCRDKREALLKVLRPNSLVVVGGMRGWWPGEATRIAKTLERCGHRVVFAARR